MKFENWVMKSENWVMETCKPNIAMPNFIYMIECCWCPFFESVPKSPYEGKPNEKQGQRPTKKIEEQEKSKERSARESDLQQNADYKFAAEYRFVADYKFAAEYRFVAEYSSSAEWLWQIKANWA